MMHLVLLLLLQSSCWAAAVKAGSSSGGSTAPNQGLSQQQRFEFLLPAWAVNRSSDLVLDFTAADAAAQWQDLAPITFRDQPLQHVSLRKGYFHGNLAVVRFGSQFITAVRKSQYYVTPRTAVTDYPVETDPSKNWISWWANKISLCSADPLTLQPTACTDYDPRSWTDCMWNAGFEPQGPEDPRLIIWPSKGLFVMFNSKPWSVNPEGSRPDDTRCAGRWAQQPFLAPLVTYSGGSGGSAVSWLAAQPSSTPLQQQHQTQQQTQSQQQQQQPQPQQQQQQQQQQPADPWTKGVIRLQYLPPELQGDPQEVQQRLQKLRHFSGPFLHKQKNWNPFIHNDELYFSQNFLPHVVIKPAPDGTCTMVHITDGAPFKHLPARPRGNAQAVLLPAAVSGLPADVYLGIVHTEVNRRYSSYLYLMEAAPTFAITAVSAPLPLVAGRHPRVPAWDHIAFPLSLQLLEDTQQLMIGYGSGDHVPRVKFMPLQEAMGLFGSSSSDGGSSGSDSVSGSSGSSRIASSSRQEAAAEAVTKGPTIPKEAATAGSSVGQPSSVSDWASEARAAAEAAVAAVQDAIGQQHASDEA